MATKVVTSAVLLLLVSMNARGQAAGANDIVFMGRKVTIIEPEHEDDGFPKGPAAVCIEGLPQRQCYTAPKDFGNYATVALVQLLKDTPALLFSAESGGVSGWQIHFALLRPDMGTHLRDLLLSDTAVSNQSQHAFWGDTSISDAQIFLTADYVWGPDEVHYGNHRYIISAYVMKQSSPLDDPAYYLEDRYMTVSKYNLDTPDILSSERREILARLKRLKNGDRKKQLNH